MNWYSVFYWLTRADSVKDFFDVFSNIFTFLTIVLFIVTIILVIFEYASKEKVSIEEWTKNRYVTSAISLRKIVQRFFYVILFLCLITWFGYMACPTKKDALLIAAGGSVITYLTNDSTARELPHDVIQFVQSELKTAAADAKVNLGILSQKDKFMKDVESMSSSEILDRMKQDTLFARMYLQYTR